MSSAIAAFFRATAQTSGRFAASEGGTLLERAGVQFANNSRTLAIRAENTVVGESRGLISLEHLLSQGASRGATTFDLTAAPLRYVQATPLYRALSNVSELRRQAIAFTFSTRALQPRLTYVPRDIDLRTAVQNTVNRLDPRNMIAEIIPNPALNAGVRARGTATGIIEEVTQTGTTATGRAAGQEAFEEAAEAAAGGAAQTGRQSLLGAAVQGTLSGGGYVVGGLMKLIGGFLKGLGSVVGGAWKGMGIALAGGAAATVATTAIPSNDGRNTDNKTTANQPTDELTQLRQAWQTLIDQSRNGLVLSDNERETLSGLLESDYNFREQLRTWVELGMIRDARRYLKKSWDNTYTVLRAQGAPETQEDAVRLRDESTSKLATATSTALGRESATAREGEMFDTVQQLMASDGFNLDIFNSDDLNELQRTREAFQSYDGASLWNRAYEIEGAKTETTWTPFLTTLSDQITRRKTYLTDEETTALQTTMDHIVTTYSNALDNRIELVSKVYEFRRQRYSNVVSAWYNYVKGYDGETTPYSFNHFPHQGTFLDTYVLSHNDTSATGTGIDTAAAAVTSGSAVTGIDTAAAAVTSGSAVTTTNTDNAIVQSDPPTQQTQTSTQSNPPTQQTPSGGVHPLFIPLLLGNIGQTVSVGRPQTEDVTMHHDLVWQPSGGNPDNYVPQQRDYVAPQTVDTTAVLLPLAALAALVLVR